VTSSSRSASRPLDPRQQLVLLARQLRITDLDQATGRCLAVSLQLALEAHRRDGTEVNLVKWRVNDDPAYIDHWAVQFDDGRVLDLTRVQVDGTHEPVCSIDDYPAHYTHRRIYPASLLRDAYIEGGESTGQRLSNGFLWARGLALFCFDADVALQCRDPRLGIAALREFGFFLACFAISGLTHALEGRVERLLRRLHERADFSARAGGEPIAGRSSTERASGSTIIDLARHKTMRTFGRGATIASRSSPAKAACVAKLRK
jgi:hypothetical protein